MTSNNRLSKSFCFIKHMITEDIYHTIHEDELFEQLFKDSEQLNFSPEEKLFLDQRYVLEKFPYHSKLQIHGFYNNLFASFKLLHEVDTILEEIKYLDISLVRARTLMNKCSFLCNASTSVMIAIDESFSFSKKYSLANSVIRIAKEIYDELMLVHTTTEPENGGNALTPETPLSLTQYDDSVNRLSCKYIRNGISVIKLFHILAILMVSPFYSDGVHTIAKNLINELRKVLYNKRIMKFIMNSDVYGNSEKAHKTTRMKILFFMNNEDRYCIRLDLPHDEEKDIHLNLNEPPLSKETAYPFHRQDSGDILRICDNKELFDSLFYEMDDLYWFRRDYEKKRKEIQKTDEEKGSALKDFFHKRGHLTVLSEDQNDKESMVLFSEAFSEALMEYGITDISGKVNEENDDLYRYVILQDIIYEIIAKIRNIELSIQLSLVKIHYDGTLKKEYYSKLCDFILAQLPQDNELVDLIDMKLDFENFISKCIDHLDSIIP